MLCWAILPQTAGYRAEYRSSIEAWQGGLGAALSLVDVRALRTLLRIDRRELALSILVTLGVVAFGAVDAILLAVVLALLRFVRLVSRPVVEILGEVPGFAGFHALSRHPDAGTVEGLVMLRFNAPIVFFNAPQFKRVALEAAQRPGTRWLVVDSCR
jgi:MFS superfamily sulfate permease-like transporter